jgi:hypothetical protein
MYVHRDRSSKGVLLKARNLPLNRETVSSGTSRRFGSPAGHYSKQVLSNFDQKSTGRIISCLRTSGLARTSTNIENQLISLWSAIEVLLSEPTGSTARIVHYVNVLEPLICLRYVRRQFVAVYESMLVAYRKQFKAITASETVMGEIDQHTRFAAIICLPQNEPLREQLLRLSADNPLALHRLFKLHKDFALPKGVIAALDGHEQRVKWQLHRIYRARNNLVHSGRSPSYLDSLVVNLDEFYRAALGTIVNWAGREKERSQIDQCVAEIGLEFRFQKAFLRKEQGKEVFSPEAVKYLLQMNPLQ